jgi:hypothetical protein
VKLVSLRPQPNAEVDEVINLSIEDDPVSRATIDHRLMPEGRQIHDRQSAEAEADRRPCRITSEGKSLVSIVIWPAVNHRAHHATDSRFNNR